ncbi:2'-5' RNA ligase family protein [Aeromicrobium wangtongii]|uniref:2'-5' RNA ligase family protein n=1 Tax=Aeromicrobium wangtongii TaxID=2969247 RepID=A0ABY5M5S7_9ACTN|nr:2'-5' RNA ligase family protein [Aeromicrobium wangtongii]MCD9199906.1 2'-5' RNA ligase family protein [Aeromicrobium wangtongii]UUP13523.1 2'-5' RNA ligase family protein [Aeromicrobium wangtongii]
MVQSVELVLDAGLDQLVREEWALLLAARLPSQARHTGESNAPHVTLGLASVVTPAAEEALRSVPGPAGMTVRLGGWLVFSGRRHVLARAVVPSADLLSLHAQVTTAMDGLPDQPSTTTPGRWTPHVTLARRLTTDQLARALDRLVGRPRQPEGTVAGLRRWDGEARVAWGIGATS